MHINPLNAPIVKSDMIIVNGVIRAKERPIQTWMEATKKDLVMLHVTKVMTFLMHTYVRDRETYT